MTPEKEAQITAALSEKLSQRAIARMLKISRDTVRNTLEKAQQIELGASLVAPLRNDSIEIDELFIRFGKKRQYRYLWIALCRLSRQVIAYFVGDRSKDSLKELWRRVPREY